MTHTAYATKERCLKNLRWTQAGLAYAITNAEQLVEQDLADDLWDIQVRLTRIVEAATRNKYRKPNLSDL